MERSTGMTKNLNTGVIMKGKKLSKHILGKVIPEDMSCRGFQYKIGINEDVNPLCIKKGEGAGLHFCFMQDICEWLFLGHDIAVIRVPDDEDVYVGDYDFRAHRIEIVELLQFSRVDTWKYLIQNGANITADNNEAVRKAAYYGCFDVVRYLHSKGADITMNDNEPIRRAAENGHFHLVKYLHQNGADITAEDNYAVKYAAYNGHLDVVKYLYKNGADITAEYNFALWWAVENRHSDVAGYLRQNGARYDGFMELN